MRFLRQGLRYALCSILGAVTAGAEVAVKCAYYREDIGCRYAWSEGAAALAKFASRDHRAGILRVYLYNPEALPVPARIETVDGTAPAGLRNAPNHRVVWWRIMPDPVPARGCAEVSVRLRTPPHAPVRLRLRLGDKRREVLIPPSDPGLRIGTIGWLHHTGRDSQHTSTEITLVAVKTGRDAMRIRRVFLDERDVTASARIAAPDFFRGLCPIQLTVSPGFPPGDFHTYRLETESGASAACTLRTLGDRVRLGMYGAGDLEQDAKLGVNTAAHFHALDRKTLDAYAAFGRYAAFHVSTPPPEVRDHPAVYAFLLHDEPDCWDYRAKEWPVDARVGFHAPEIVADTQRFGNAAPRKPVMMTLDLTFKPANYYTYGQIPDIVVPDCYPLTIGQPLSMVREVVETCRLAAGPRRVEAVVQVDFEDRRKTNMKFRRPPFAGEVAIQYLYALGAGARGFSGWEWFDEKADWCFFHGARNYPDVLEAVRSVYRRFSMIAPLIIRAHPADIAESAAAHLWLKTLVCGTRALLVVAVNDDYESGPADFVQRARHHVTIRLPSIPWLKPAAIARVKDETFEKLPFESASDGTRFVVRELKTGAVFLIAGDPGLIRRLAQRYRALSAADGTAILAGSRRMLAEKARRAAFERLLRGRLAAYALSASTLLHAYGVADEALWNPKGEKYPGMEWWTQKTPRGGEWTVHIDEHRPGKAYVLFFQMQRWWGGGFLRIEVLKPDGTLVMRVDRPQWHGPIPHVPLHFPGPGRYRVRILQAGHGKPGGRLAKTVYLAPENLAPAERDLTPF